MRLICNTRDLLLPVFPSSSCAKARKRANYYTYEQRTPLICEQRRNNTLGLGFIRALMRPSYDPPLFPSLFPSLFLSFVPSLFSSLFLPQIFHLFFFLSFFLLVPFPRKNGRNGPVEGPQTRMWANPRRKLRFFNPSSRIPKFPQKVVTHARNLNLKRTHPKLQTRTWAHP